MTAAAQQHSMAKVQTLLKQFRLPTAASEMGSRLLEAGLSDALEVVAQVLEAEADDRLGRRVDRLRRASRLPPGKTMAALDLARFGGVLPGRIKELAGGDFVDRAENVLAFGLPGTGKTHVACAIGHDLVTAGRSVLFAPTFRMVQQLLAAKRDLALPRMLRKLDRFDVLILDDLGYVQQGPDEVEVLFTLMAERYERRSLVITSNLVFSEWGQIFNNPMTTAAAIDRLVHHCTVLEMDVESFRTQAAMEVKGK